MSADPQAVIENGEIVIRISVSELPTIVEGSWLTGNLDMRFKVTDAPTFAQHLAYAMNSDDEEGTTRVHRLLDSAINEALEQGADGIEEHEVQDA